jgi:hypothetical protein
VDTVKLQYPPHLNIFVKKGCDYMGVVNSPSQLNMFNSHRTLESINPNFTYETPIYSVVNAMKYDNAEYTIYVESVGRTDLYFGLEDNINAFWMAYPESGTCRIKITTYYNGDNKKVRVVECKCESGRTYVNTFTQKNGMVYDGQYKSIPRYGRPVVGGRFDGDIITLEDIEYLVNYAHDPSKIYECIDFDSGDGLTENPNIKSANHRDLVLTTIYGVGENDVNHADIVDGMSPASVSVNGIKPSELISKGYILDMAWALAEYGSVKTFGDTSLGDILNKWNDVELAKVFSHALDIRTLPYVMLDALYIHKNSDTFMLSNWLYGMTDKGIFDAHKYIDLYDIIAIYIGSTQWDYTGWEYNGNALPIDGITPIFADPSNKTSIQSDNGVNMYDVRRYFMYRPDADKTSLATTCSTVNPNTYRYGRIKNIGTINCVDILRKWNTHVLYTELKKFCLTDIPFAPIKRAETVCYIDRIPYGGMGNIYDILINIPEYVNISGNINFDEYSKVKIKFMIEADGSTVIDVEGYSNDTAMDDSLEALKYSALSICGFKDKAESIMIDKMWDNVLSEDKESTDYIENTAIKSDIINIPATALDEAPIRELEISGTSIYEDGKITSTTPQLTIMNCGLYIPQDKWKNSDDIIVNEDILSPYSEDCYILYHAEVDNIHANSDNSNYPTYSLKILYHDGSTTHELIDIAETPITHLEYNMPNSEDTMLTSISGLDGYFVLPQDAKKVIVKCKNINLKSINFTTHTENTPISHVNTVQCYDAKSDTITELPTLRGINSISDKIVKRDNVWVNEINIHDCKIHAKKYHKASGTKYVDYSLFVNDRLATIILDKDASTGNTGVFHIGIDSNPLAYTTTANYATCRALTGIINVANRDIKSTNIITDKVIPCGEEVTNGESTVSLNPGEIAVYLHPPIDKAGAYSSPLSQYIVLGDEFIGEGCSFNKYDDGVIPNGSKGASLYDKYGNISSEQCKYVITIAINFKNGSVISDYSPMFDNAVEIDGDDMRYNILRYLESNPIIFQYIPQFSYYNGIGYASHYPISTANGVLDDFIIRDKPLSPAIQDKLNGIKVYSGGALVVTDKNRVGATMKAKYILDLKKYLSAL